MRRAAARGARPARARRISRSTPASATLPVALQQLVEIARALAQADTACSSSTSRRAAWPGRRARGCSTAIATLKARGLTILYISHFLEEVQAIADRFTVLRDGRTVGAGRSRGTAGVRHRRA